MKRIILLTCFAASALYATPLQATPPHVETAHEAEVGVPRQAAAVILGRVLDGNTMQPLASVQVSIAALGVGTLTNADGQYRLAGPQLTAGTHEIRFDRIGYRAATRSVTLGPNQTLEVNVELRQEALALDEVVVTGTAGGTQRRAIGNVVQTLAAEPILEVAPVNDVQGLLSQRTPGLIVLPAAGQVGTGAPLRIRGMSSMSLANEPIVYIDGIRMDSDPRRGPSTRGGSRMSRLNDLNPNDIASIEIIKGPSAATLYGTEASNGVIQIITKRGATGASRLDVSVRAGTNWMMNPEGRAGLQWRRNAETGELEGFNLLEQEVLRGFPPVFSNGYQQGYNLSLRGGTDAVRYFTSASWDDETGVVGYDFHKRFNARGNLDVVLTDNLSLRTSTGYMQTRTRLAQNPGGFGAEPFSSIIWGNPATLETPQRGFMVAPPEEWGKVQTRGDNDRTMTSLELRYNPVSWSSHRLALGMDLNDETNWQLWPRQPEGGSHFWGIRALGEKSVDRLNHRFLTADYAGSAAFDVLEDFRLTSSVGLQFYQRETSVIFAEGTEFPAIPITTISGGAQRTGGETFEENITLGAYVQQQVDWRNRVFLTGAVRADDNSAFGAEYDAAIYPKLSATWVVHEEPFWTLDWVDQLRLRTAWGAAGQQPGTFDAPRLYGPSVGYQDQPSLIPVSFGNPQLKPERGEELEYGFDVSLLDERVGLVFTRYHRAVKDAIVQRPIPTSTGFSGNQIVNLGHVRAWGTELGVDLRVLERSGFRWEIGTQFARMGNEIEDLGGLSFVPAGGQQEHREGFSIGAFFAKKVLSAEIDEGGFVLSAMCDGGTGTGGVDMGGSPVPCQDAPRVHWGSSAPTWQVGVNSTFTILDNLRLYARVEGNGGHWNFNSELRAAHNVGVTEVVLRRDDPLVQATRQYENNVMGFHLGGFARLREAGATYTLPTGWVQHVGASRGSISVAGRNLAMLWTAEHGWDTWRDGRVMPPNGFGGRWSWDAELRSVGNVQADQQTVMPPLTSATMTVRLSF